MKAVGFYQSLPISDINSLVDIEIDKPKLVNDYDLLVKVETVSVNPVDYKVRLGSLVNKSTEAKVLGWDVSGVVEEIGSKCDGFAVGDKVFYAGDITRQGGNSEYHLIDSRIVGHAPKNVSSAEAASLPLTSLTAWEALFEGLNVDKNNAQKSILIINGAGGVGSIAIQLAKQLTKLKVIATASRAESVEWCLNLGADNVVNHHLNLVEQVRALGYQYVDYILILNNTQQHIASCAELCIPFGGICTIVETSDGTLDIGLLKTKSLTFSQEFMYTRSMYQTPDMIEQQKILNSISELIEKGAIRHTAKTMLSPINASNLRKAHELLEGGRVIAKIVISGF